MIKLGQWVILTRNELIETVNDEKALAYRRGLHSKWKAKKKGEIEALLAAVDPDVVIPQRKADLNDFISRNAETYEKPKAGIPAVTSATWPGTGYSQGNTVDLKVYGDSLPIIEDAELVAEIKARFDMKETEEKDAA